MKHFIVIFHLAFFCLFLHPNEGFAQNHVLSLDGDGDYVRIENTPELQAAADGVMTIEAWFMPKKGGWYVPIISKTNDQAWQIGTDKDWDWLITGSGRIEFRSTIDDRGYWQATPYLLKLNQWYHVAVVVNRPKRLFRLFLNGVLVAEDREMGISRLETRHYSNWCLRMKSRRSPRFARGDIDEVRIWNVARTQTEIQKTMSTSLRGSEPGLVGYWRFDGQDETAIDATAHGHDGQLFGDAVRVAHELPAPDELLTHDEMYGRYLESLRLFLSVERHKPERFKDVLSITARRIPDNTVWTAPPIPIHLEIEAENGQPLARFEANTNETVTWAVPDDVEGTLRIFAKHAAGEAKDREAKFICQAHSIRPVTPKVGHWETIDVTNGLGGASVYSMIQDSKGVLWFGLRNGGVTRYDGRRFRTLTTNDGLPSNNVYTVFEDSKGVLWFGLRGKGAGVCRYDGTGFQTFTEADGLVDNRVIAIHEDDQGNLWFGTMRGVSKFDGTTFDNYTTEQGLPRNLVGSIAQDLEGNLWFGHGRRENETSGGIITRYDGNSFKRFTTADGLVHGDVKHLMVDADGNLWLATIGGVSRFDGERFQSFTTADGLVSDKVMNILQTQNGDLWFATIGGVSRYRDGAFQNFTSQDGLATNAVWSMAEDREGVLWFGTYSAGVSRYDRRFESVSASILEEGALSKDAKGNLWFGVSGVGLGKYDGENIQTFGIEDGLPDGDTYKVYGDGVPDNDIWSIYEDRQGNLWIATWSGLVRYDGETFETFTTQDGLPSRWVEHLYEDKDGVLWLGMQEGGVCTYNGEKFVPVAELHKLRTYLYLGGITGDRRGNIWISVRGAGLLKYDGKMFTRLTVEDGLPNATVYSPQLADRNDHIWFGTQGTGAIRYDGANFQSFTIDDGLASNTVETIFEDSGGYLWIGTAAGGVSKFDGRNFQTFTTDDGLFSNTVQNVLEDDAGNIIFGTSAGITTYTPPEEKIPPSVFVTEVVADKTYPASVGAHHAAPLKIPSTAKTIRFAYYGTSFSTNRMRYNYMLEGVDKDWQATWDEQASYENLKPGDYTFKVIAINRDLVYSEAPATVKLKIVPPWYKNGLIIFPSGGGILAMLIASFFFGSRYYTQRRESQRLRDEMLEQERQNSQILEEKNTELQESKETAEIAKETAESRGQFQVLLSF